MTPSRKVSNEGGPEGLLSKNDPVPKSTEKKEAPKGLLQNACVRAYALFTEPNCSMSSLVRATMASRPGLRSLRGS